MYVLDHHSQVWGVPSLVQRIHWVAHLVLEDLVDTQQEDRTVVQVDLMLTQEDQVVVLEDLTEAWEDL